MTQKQLLSHNEDDKNNFSEAEKHWGTQHDITLGLKEAGELFQKKWWLSYRKNLHILTMFENHLKLSHFTNWIFHIICQFCELRIFVPKIKRCNFAIFVNFSNIWISHQKSKGTIFSIFANFSNIWFFAPEIKRCNFRHFMPTF